MSVAQVERLGQELSHVPMPTLEWIENHRNRESERIQAAGIDPKRLQFLQWNREAMLSAFQDQLIEFRNVVIAATNSPDLTLAWTSI